MHGTRPFAEIFLPFENCSNTIFRSPRLLREIRAKRSAPNPFVNIDDLVVEITNDEQDESTISIY